MPRKIPVLFFLLPVILASCATTKDKKSFSYFNNLPKDSVYVVKDAVSEDADPKLKAGDVISIRVSTLDQTTNILFNEGVLTTGANATSGNGTLQTDGYKLDSKGNVQLPLIGKLNLQGKSLEEAQIIITQKIATQAKNPIVSIRLLNAQVMVMGEVGRPGPINITDRKTSILEAIGRAGEVTSTAKKDEILVIRTNNGQKEHAFLNLNDIAVINSPYYYLRQDDMVIVYPTNLKEKQVRGALRGIEITTLSFGILSSSLSLLSLYFNLKYLTEK
ncbi:MAG: polysaccharide export protein [Sphingobacteriales bacterium]|nr:MAG: polysaccharide export protein [Sphingobacteriales bacterium]